MAPPLGCFAALVPPPRFAAFRSRRRDALIVMRTFHAQLDCGPERGRHAMLDRRSGRGQHALLGGGSERGQAALHARNIGRIKVAYNDTRKAWHAAGYEVVGQEELSRVR